MKKIIYSIVALLIALIAACCIYFFAFAEEKVEIGANVSNLVKEGKITKSTNNEYNIIDMQIFGVEFDKAGLTSKSGKIVKIDYSKMGNDSKVANDFEKITANITKEFGDYEYSKEGEGNYTIEHRIWKHKGRKYNLNKAEISTFFGFSYIITLSIQ